MQKYSYTENFNVKEPVFLTAELLEVMYCHSSKIENLGPMLDTPNS